MKTDILNFGSVIFFIVKNLNLQPFEFQILEFPTC